MFVASCSNMFASVSVKILNPLGVLLFQKCAVYGKGPLTVAYIC